MTSESTFMSSKSLSLYKKVSHNVKKYVNKYVRVVKNYNVTMSKSTKNTSSCQWVSHGINKYVVTPKRKS